MSNLNATDILVIQKIIEKKTKDKGLVWDFTNATFKEFVESYTGLDIYDDKYEAEDGGSKIKRLKMFLKIEEDSYVIMLLQGIEEYGKKRFKHSFFETLPNNSFKHLVLKPFASSWNYTGALDYLSNIYASSLDLETVASRPLVLYLNGEYWGIYYIHERPDERYLEDHLGVNIDNVNIISGWNPILDHGTLLYFNQFYDWMETADLSDDEAYSYAETKMDMSNFIDYQIFELFSENTDWPANNMRMWQEGDGPWRWIFYDGDACFRWNTFYAFDNSIYVGDEWWPSSTKATLFFRKLLTNETFTNRFKSRFLELLQTTFMYSALEPEFEHIKTSLEPEVPWQSQRFGFPADIQTWVSDMGQTRWFLQQRAESLQGVLDGFLEVPEMASGSFVCYPNPSHDVIHVYVDCEATEKGEVAIYDLLGRKVFAQHCEMHQGPNDIVLQPHLHAGIYVLRIGNLTRKIVRY